MELKIYDKQGLVKMTVSPDNSSQWNHEVGVENVVTVNFTTWEFLVLEVGWYILVEGQRFSIKSEYRPKHIHDTKYTYNLKFYGREHDAQDILFCRLNQGEDDLESVFAYDGTPMDFLQKVVANMNRNTEGVVWKVGESITANRRTINFNGLYCWDALSEIARTFGTEWWLDGEYLNISKCERGESVSLGYGQGLKSGLTQNENTNAVKWFTRLIPVGSSKNIDKNKYGYFNLQLPGREKYIDINSQYGLKEYREEAAFSEIYPNRVGTISSVRSETRTNEETGEYTVFFVKDSSLPFNPDEYMIGGEVIHMSFNSGSLAGKDFEVNWNNETKEFEIINKYPDDNTQLPGGNLVPNADDKYVLWNISMPDEYIRAAEQEYKEAVDAYLAEYSKDISIYSGNTDYIYIDQYNVPLSLGQRVRLLSGIYFGNIGRDSRITRVSRKLNNLSDATIDCSDAIASSWKSSVDSSLNQLQFSVAKEIANTIIDILKTGDSKEPSNYNVLSALRSLNTFLSKTKDDRSAGIIASDKGFEAGKFNVGTTGAACYQDKDGNWHIETDHLKVRKKAVFSEVEVETTYHVGGQQISTGASMVVDYVLEMETCYRCYFLKRNGEGREINNQWEPKDQAYCNTFNLASRADGTSGNHYLWRLVEATSNEKKDDADTRTFGEDTIQTADYHFVDLSKSVYAVDSDAPELFDEIVLLGHRGDDANRKNAIVLAGAGEGSPYIYQFTGIDTFHLPEPEIKIKPGDNKFTGVMHIEGGSTGAKNLEDLPEEVFKAVHIGAVNLLRNSGFTGDYKAEELNASYQLDSNSELFSNNLKHWTGTASVLEESWSVSGKAATIGSLSQTVEVIKDENYVVSFNAKGENVTVSLGGVKETIALNSEYDKHSVKIVSDGVCTFSISGNATIYDLQLERGTIETDWHPSPYDNDKALAEFQALKYIQDAIQEGDTTILGGLILSSMIQLGNYKDGKMQKVNAGMSGIYNDDDDVAFWGGGTFEQAIRTIVKFKQNPNYSPTTSEWADMANFVVSHGGDLFFRGTIFAENGYFRGMIMQGNGATILEKDGSGQLANGVISWNRYGVMKRKSHDIIKWVSIYDYDDTKSIQLERGTYLDLTYALSESSFLLPDADYDGTIISLIWEQLSRSNDCAVLRGKFKIRQISESGVSYISASKFKLGKENKEVQLVYSSSESAWVYRGENAIVENGFATVW